MNESNKKPFIKKANLMIYLNKEFNKERSKFLGRTSSFFGIDKTSNKIGSFWNLSFDEFQKEIYRLSKKKLSLKEQDEWEDYFNEYKKDILNLRQKIWDTDEKIDQLVYELYDLTDEEIKIVEGS